jgi:hypothetical protein
MVILADLFFSIPCSELKRVQSPPSRLLLLLPRPPIVTASMSKKTAPERLRARTGDPKALVPAAPHLLAACVRRIKWRWEWPENKHIITCIYLNIYGILRGCVCVLLKCTWIDQYPQNLQHWDTIRIYMIDPSIHLPVTSIQNQDYKSRNRVLTQTRISQTCLVIHVGFDTMDLSKKMGDTPIWPAIN